MKSPDSRWPVTALCASCDNYSSCTDGNVSSAFVLEQPVAGPPEGTLGFQDQCPYCRSFPLFFVIRSCILPPNVSCLLICTLLRLMGLLWLLRLLKNLPVIQETWVDLWVWKIPWRMEWLPTAVFLPGEFHRKRSLVGYSPWGCKESDTTEQLTLSETLKIP